MHDKGGFFRYVLRKPQVQNTFFRPVIMFKNQLAVITVKRDDQPLHLLYYFHDSFIRDTWIIFSDRKNIIAK